jgi:hypothetical protein
MSILDKASAIEEMEKERLPLIKGLMGGVTPGVASIWRNLQAAEVDVAARLMVSLEPVEVFPVVPPTEDEIAALDGVKWEVEPGYDLDGAMLGSFQWGTIKLARRPLIKVHSVKFVYPTFNEPIYDVPLDWIYPDLKAGMIQFAPKPTPSGLAPSLVAANLMARGGNVPQLVRVRYRAGLTPESEFMPAIMDLIHRMAMLRYLKFTPQSASISADGMSQSKSIDAGKFREELDAELEVLAQRIKGPVWGIL